MTKLIFAAAASLVLAGPALAGERTFKHEGVTYAYTVKQDGDARILEGTASSGGDFRLVVKNGWVDGRVHNVRVSYRAPTRRKAAVLVAQR